MKNKFRKPSLRGKYDIENIRDFKILLDHIEKKTRRMIRSPRIFDDPKDALDLVHEKIGERDFSGKTMKIALFTSGLTIKKIWKAQNLQTWYFTFESINRQPPTRAWKTSTSRKTAASNSKRYKRLFHLYSRWHVKNDEKFCAEILWQFGIGRALQKSDCSAACGQKN